MMYTKNAFSEEKKKKKQGSNEINFVKKIT